MLDAFEMWLWRTVLRVSWIKRQTNEWVREQVGQKERYLSMEVKRRNTRQYRHRKRRGESMVPETIEGETEASRRGEKKEKWVRKHHHLGRRCGQC